MRKEITLGMIAVLSLILVISGIFAFETGTNSNEITIDNSNEKSGNNSNVCSVIEYNGKCYDFGDSFSIKIRERFYTSSGPVYVESIYFPTNLPDCEGDECKKIKVTLQSMPGCNGENGEKNCILGGKSIIISQGEIKEIGENIGLKLISANAGENTAMFEISTDLIPICKVGCVCSGDVITCPNEQETTITTEVESDNSNEGPSGKKNSESDSGKVEITITKTESGNLIKSGEVEVEAKNVKVVDSKLYAGEKEITIMPDTASEIAIEKLKTLNFTIELKDTGQYHIKTEKQARLFFIVPVKEKQELDISGETGEIISFNKPWWGFLAKEI